MCGIAGIVNLRHGLPPPEHDRLAAMLGMLAHRGPDEFGMYRDARAGLAHARLSIIDLSTGQQPLTNETSDVWLVFNGEIYNYLELRAELLARGHAFRTQSDTEVIVHAYEEWGPDAFSRFNGQWAVVLWDAAAESLVLARDPFGVRPLFFGEFDGKLYFASEVKAIFANPEIPRALDPLSIQQVFTFWTRVAPRSGYVGIRELEPGTVTVYRNGAVLRYSSYQPAFPQDRAGEFSGTVEDATEAVHAALEESTRLRMLRADVPVGSYLSGGLDSSLVASLGLAAKKTRFCTYSLRFEDAEYDETPYQREMASFLGSDHREVVVARDDIARVFPDVIFHTEQPILRTAPAPLYLLSKLVHDSGIKVVLTGEGADEMFAGYDLFREGKIRRFWARHPDSAWRPRLIERLYPYLDRSPVRARALSRQFFGQSLAEYARPGFAHGLRWRGTAALQRLLEPPFQLPGIDVAAELIASLPPGFARQSALAQDQQIEIRTLLSGYLLASQGDRMLMAHSVEGRFPFLDRQVAALAESLPPAYKLRVLDEKHVLKRVGCGLIPKAILERKKQPYRAPDALAFLGPTAREWIEEVASPKALELAGVFRPREARQLIDKCLSHTGDAQFSNADNMALVGVLSTQLVYERIIRRLSAPHRPLRLTTAVDRLTAPSVTSWR
jgi:asparagine synthase (glutamine-hydrolysing)